MDRGFGNEQLIKVYPYMVIKIAPTTTSDHMALLFNGVGVPMEMGKKGIGLSELKRGGSKKGRFLL